MTTIKTPIVDKNGKHTHVHRAVRTASLPSVKATPPVPPVAATEKPNFDERGFDAEGVHVSGKRVDLDGFNAKGWREDGIHRDTGEAWDERGWRRDGKHRLTNTQVDPDGFHKNGSRPGEAEANREKGKEERAAKAAAKKASIYIPYEATQARERAKALGAKWQPGSKTWLIKPEHVAEVEALIDAQQDAAFQDLKVQMQEKALADHLENQERDREAAEFRATATVVVIPYEGGEDDRVFVKSLGAKWQPTEKVWLLPPEGVEQWQEYREAHPEPEQQPAKLSRRELAELAEDGISVPENNGMAPWERYDDERNPFGRYHHIDDPAS